MLPDGVGVRNFLCTRFVDLLLKEGEVVVWHALPPESVEAHEGRWGGRVRWRALPDVREGLPERLFRNAKTFSQLYWHHRGEPTRAMLSFRKTRSRRWKVRLFHHASHLLGRLMGSSSGTRALDRLHAAATRRASYLEPFRDVLAEESPDVVFCTHQRASRAVPAMIAAAAEGIETATFVFSWDNLPKGRMAVHADHFLVWSRYMRDELLDYYPEIEGSRVHVVGTPQFEPYFTDEWIRPRDAFLEELGLDPERPVVCFSGDDFVTSPRDQDYLRDLAEAVASLPEDGRPQVLFRRCPTEWSDRYDAVLEDHPGIAVSDPAWLRGGEDWTGVVPTAEDVKLLANVVHHSDLVVNLGSTMAMDFAILDKPAVYVRYDPPAAADLRWTAEAVYRQPHFDTVRRFDPVYWAREPGDLPELVTRALERPAEKRAAREAWLETQVAHPLDRASHRCRDVLKALASGGTTDRAAAAVVDGERGAGEG